MREHIRRLIDRATRPADPLAPDGHGDSAIRLAAETIRLARLAASTHMVLWAGMPVQEPSAEGRTTS